MKNELMSKATRLLSSTQFQLKKHSPELLMTAGIVGTLVGTVLACKATTKVKDIMDAKEKAVQDVHTCLEDETVEYTEEDSKKDLTIIYGQTGLKIAKLYAPAASIMTISILSIIAGNRILTKRSAAIAAAYAVVDGSFKKYRKNVVDKFGEAVDQELRYSIRKEEIQSKKGKDGKSKKEVVEYIDGENDDVSRNSEYARFFDEGCSDYEKDAEYNMMFLRRQQDYANEMLKSRGHLFLNEVYDLLDIPRSKAGQVVGWVYNKDGNTKGDNYVDFNIYDVTDEAKRRFVNGYERNILLDFNVDGVIYDLI